MRSPATSGTAMVPEGRVGAFKERGWSLVDQPEPAKKAPAKKAASPKKPEK